MINTIYLREIIASPIPKGYSFAVTVSPKFYSININNNILKDTEFLEWFTGFIDGEGSFKKDSGRSKSPFVFEFLINLHRDDLKVLEDIQTRLNLGKIKNFYDYSRLSVLNKAGIKQLIDILT